MSGFRTKAAGQKKPAAVFRIEPPCGGNWRPAVSLHAVQRTPAVCWGDCIGMRAHFAGRIAPRVVPLLEAGGDERRRPERRIVEGEYFASLRREGRPMGAS